MQPKKKRKTRKWQKQKKQNYDRIKKNYTIENEKYLTTL